VECGDRRQLADAAGEAAARAGCLARSQRGLPQSAPSSCRVCWSWFWRSAKGVGAVDCCCRWGLPPGRDHRCVGLGGWGVPGKDCAGTRWNKGRPGAGAAPHCLPGVLGEGCCSVLVGCAARGGRRKAAASTAAASVAPAAAQANPAGFVGVGVVVKTKGKKENCVGVLVMVMTMMLMLMLR